MFEKIEMMQMARALGRHVAERQNIVARNIANSDTPGYKARDLEPFETAYHRLNAAPMRATDPRHLSVPDWTPAGAQVMSGETGVSPNGNSVSLEAELLKAAELKRGHDLSLAIYRSGLDMLRTSIGRRG
ncbi:FlgB family protein [Paracoccus caeni]|uniref:FlgB family protein n=1 Tax=Paracoccus caeni TaxID=657651 RepID=A0A934W000_9RHOB|nr:FlgB family protein [Paracoccus caeni]MBK4216390.1 FlgB family protein [Paracoccus caeni]